MHYVVTSRDPGEVASEMRKLFSSNSDHLKLSNVGAVDWDLGN